MGGDDSLAGKENGSQTKSMLRTSHALGPQIVSVWDQPGRRWSGLGQSPAFRRKLWRCFSIVWVPACHVRGEAANGLGVQGAAGGEPPCTASA